MLKDDPADTVRPRLEALGADLDRIPLLQAIQHEDIVRSFHLDRDLEYLEKLLREIGDAALIVIDPISAYLGQKDSYKDSDMRSLLLPLSRIVEENNVALIAISHLNKSSEKKAMHRVSGSIALVASARTAFTVTADREDPQRRLMLQLKNNLAIDGKGFAFRLKTVELANGIDTSKVVWEPDHVTIPTDEAMASEEQAERITATNEAEEFLREILKDGPLPVTQIKREAEGNGITDKPLRTASKRLNIEKKKIGYSADSYWEWSLPTDVLPTRSCPSGKEGIFEEKGHLQSEEA